jgi:vacuolar-type H+-ATPase subunit I/STV1
MYKLNNNKFKSALLLTTFLGNSFLSVANSKESEKKVRYRITSKEISLNEKEKIKIFKKLKNEQILDVIEQIEELEKVKKIALEELKNQQDKIKKDALELSSSKEKILSLQNIISQKESYIKDLSQKISDLKNYSSIKEVTVEELKEIAEQRGIKFEDIYFTVQTSSFKKYADAIKYEGELRKKNFKPYITAKYDTKEGIRVEIPIKEAVVIEKKVKSNAKPVANKSSK